MYKVKAVPQYLGYEKDMKRIGKGYERIRKNMMDMNPRLIHQRYPNLVIVVIYILIHEYPFIFCYPIKYSLSYP